ncbi:MAG: hypothetical protein ACYTF0_06575, partial [Planctomycetota bacterium]|jgi:hypothetical protein
VADGFSALGSSELVQDDAVDDLVDMGEIAGIDDDEIVDGSSTFDAAAVDDGVASKAPTRAYPAARVQTEPLRSDTDPSEDETGSRRRKASAASSKRASSKRAGSARSDRSDRSASAASGRQGSKANAKKSSRASATGRSSRSSSKKSSRGSARAQASGNQKVMMVSLISAGALLLIGIIIAATLASGDVPSGPTEINRFEDARTAIREAKIRAVSALNSNDLAKVNAALEGIFAINDTLNAVEEQARQEGMNPDEIGRLIDRSLKWDELNALKVNLRNEKMKLMSRQ